MSATDKTSDQKIPGIIYAASDQEKWQGLNALSIDWQPVNQEPFIIPEQSGITLGYRLEGAIKSRCQLGDGPWLNRECRKNEFLIMPANQETRWSWKNISDENNSLLTMIINIEQSLIDTVASKATDTDQSCIEFHHQTNLHDYAVSHIVKRLHAELNNHDPLSKLSIAILKQELVVHLLRHHSVFSNKITPDENHGLSKSQLLIVTDYIESYYFKEITLKDLANLINLSEYHFSRQYKKATNITPYQYILNCRFTKAQQLLETTNLAIKQIAFRVGYKDANVFSKAFVKYFGITAAQHRKQLLS